MKKLFTILMLVFSLGVLTACTGPNDPVNQDAETLREVSQTVNIVVDDINAVTGSFTVYTVLKDGVTATWVSDNPTHALVQDAVAGVSTIRITRPNAGENDAVVKLTATLKLNSETLVKEFTITILARPADVLLKTIAEYFDMAKNDGAASLDGVSAEVENAVVVHLDSDAYWIADDTGAIMVYGTPSAAIQVGQKGTILGKLANNFDAIQFTGATSGFTPDSEGQTVTPTQINLADYWVPATATANEIKALKSTSSKLQYVQFDAVVKVRPDFTGGSNYQYTLVDADTAETTFDQDFVLSYYKAPLHDSVLEMDGLPVIVTAVIRELRDARATNATIGTRPIWSFSIASIVIGEVPADQKAQIDANALKLPTQVVENSTLGLLAVGARFGSTVTWAFTDNTNLDNSVLDLETKAVTIPTDDSIKTLKLTATVVNGESTVTRNFEIEVGMPAVSTIEQVQTTVVVGKIVKIVGTITGSNGNNQITIQDASGAVTIYGSFNELKELVGKKVTIIGQKDVYSDLVQIKDVTVLTTSDDGDDYSSVNLDGSESLGNDVLFPLVAQKVSFTSLIVVSVTTNASNHTTFIFRNVDGHEITGFLHSAVASLIPDHVLLTLQANDIINMTSFVGMSSGNGQLGFGAIGTEVETVSLSDASAVALQKATVEIQDNIFLVSGEITLPVPAIAQVSFAWVSSAESIVITDGKAVVTVGEEIESVTITLTLSAGEVTETKGFVITLAPVVKLENKETFNNSNAWDAYGGNGSSYKDYTITGDNGVEWTIVDGLTVTTSNQVANSIDETGILFRGTNNNTNTTTSSISVTLQSVGVFTFEYRKAFTSAAARKYAVTVDNNGESSTYLIPEFGQGQGAQTTVYTMGLALNLTGETVITIHAISSSAQAVFDNFAWSNYSE